MHRSPSCCTRAAWRDNRSRWSIGSYAATPSGLRARVDLDDVCLEARTAGLLDAATHIAALAGASDSRLFVPATVEQVWVADPLPRSQWFGFDAAHRR